MPKKVTITDMHTLAAQRGGICLSPEYVHSTHKLTWQCANGHVWDATPTNIKSGYWCPLCQPNRPLGIEQMRQLAKQHGGTCVSEQYVNNYTKLRWQCANGHQWEAVPSTIKRGHWCPECAAVAPLTIEEMRTLAASRGGKCLSEEYVNAYTPLLWECAQGHRWWARPGNVKFGKWCRQCAYQKKRTRTR